MRNGPVDTNCLFCGARIELRYSIDGRPRRFCDSTCYRRWKGDATPRPAREFGLTARQLQVVKLLWEGRSYKQIAFELGLSYATVKTYMYGIGKDLGLSGMVAVALWYERTVAPKVRRDTIPA